MASEPTTRDVKLIQYLNEAYGKEKELEIALQAHIAMTDRKPYRKRLQDHLHETKQQARGLERRIKALGGKATPVDLPGPDVVSEAATQATSLANKAVSLAKGQMHVLRGTGDSEKLLKNAKTELWNEYEEIGTYLAIESLAASVGDKETVKMAREFRRQEERMASFLQRLIPQLSKSVAREEIPAAERRTNGGRRSTRSADQATREPALSARRRSGPPRSGPRPARRPRATAASAPRRRGAGRPPARAALRLSDARRSRRQRPHRGRHPEGVFRQRHDEPCRPHGGR